MLILHYIKQFIHILSTQQKDTNPLLLIIALQIETGNEGHDDSFTCHMSSLSSWQPI